MKIVTDTRSQPKASWPIKCVGVIVKKGQGRGRAGVKLSVVVEVMSKGISVDLIWVHPVLGLGSVTMIK